MRLIDADELIRTIEGENEDVDEFDNPQKAPRSGYSLGLLRRVISAQHDKMSAQQYGDTWKKICKQHSNEPCVAGCPLGKLESLCCCALPTKETIAIVEKWAREHPKERSEE